MKLLDHGLICQSLFVKVIQKFGLISEHQVTNPFLFTVTLKRVGIVSNDSKRSFSN